MSEPFQKTLRPGTVPAYGGGRMSVFITVDFDGTRLSVTGVEGPRASGNCVGACGQIEMHYAHRDPSQNDGRTNSESLTSPSDFNFADGWDEETWLDLLATWHDWHLNDMRAECEHQRALGWTYDTHTGQDCPECGYRIASAWLTEDVPETVLDFLRGLPEADKPSPWA